MNLIANTGIQLFTMPLEINVNDNFKMYFHEWIDTDGKKLKLEIAHYFPDEEVWVKKYDLAKLGSVKDGQVTESWDVIKEAFFDNGYKLIDPQQPVCFQVSMHNIENIWNKFENVWFPFPFFLLDGERSKFGPTNWCRCKLIPVEPIGMPRKYNLLLAFDTRSIFEDEDFQDEDLNETPVFTGSFDRSKQYALCNNEYQLLGYCSKYEKRKDGNGNPVFVDCDWVDKYLLKHFLNLTDIYEYRGPLPKLNYLAQYIFLIRYIQQRGVLPKKITLYSNKNALYSNVDLVVDIGNSRTCAVLFDNSDLEKTSPLELQDFTTPVAKDADALNKYRDSFDMRLAFRKADFGGTFGLDNSRQFVYPSMIRLGKEANRLIHKATNMNTEAEKTSTFSSPKRFLWDTKLQKQEWEWVQLEDETTESMDLEGILEQLNADGSLNTNAQGSFLKCYPRRALMTFAFLEIIAQATMQINSYEQRSHWGNESKPRKIGRIMVTCPIAMSREEQRALRKCAEDAAIIVKRFDFLIQKYYLLDIQKKTPGGINAKIDDKIKELETLITNIDRLKKEISIIPSGKKLPANDERTEWIYDEATAAQFVFLYAEIRERYLKNAKDYFDFYGKVRNDLDGYEQKTLTIGSVDIGAGTTDVMIAAYKYDGDAGQCTLTPVPLFWESFYKAGDDLLKDLIRQLVIEGKHSPIETKLRALGKDPVDLMQLFLGTNNGVSARNQRLRSDFNLQVSVSIVSRYLELLKEDKVESRILSFDNIFSDNPPTQNVLDHFKQHFGFEFESLQWPYERKVVAAIVEKTFDSLIGKISSLFSYYACDIVLLAGRPTSLKPLSDLFLKHYAISPNRLKSMNDYRIGRWYPQDTRYPFIDGNGKFIHPKSIITTGAMIGQRAENGGLNGFSLNLKELKKKLLPTTHFFGKLDDQLAFTETIISPDTNRATIEVSSLPFRIGVRQLDTSAYPSRPFYMLVFDDDKIEDFVKGIKDPNDESAVQQGIKDKTTSIEQNMPLRLTIERDTNEDIERLRMEEMVDQEGRDIKRFFSLQVQSMSEVDNFWLDSGIFSLNINMAQN